MRVSVRTVFSLILAMTMLWTAASGEQTGAAVGSGTIRDSAELAVGNPTPLTGKFFTGMWNGTTSDEDVRHLLHGYAPVTWSAELGRYRIDTGVVRGAMISDGENGDRTYFLTLREDLKYSDGSGITARDYAFTLLFQMDDAIRQTGGIPADNSWIAGAEEYARGEADTLRGVRLMNEYTLAITARAASLPHFQELARLRIYPYPIAELAPGNAVLDEGNGVYLKEKLTAEGIAETVLDPEDGYMTAPKVVSGPYTLDSFDGTKAELTVNPYFQETEDGSRPTIQHLTCRGADDSTMIRELEAGEFGLLNKVTGAEAIVEGLELAEKEGHAVSEVVYPRSGLTLFRFHPDSRAVQTLAVRKAIVLCMDREAIVRDYLGDYGIVVDGLYGIGGWQTRLMKGAEAFPLQASGGTPQANKTADENAATEWEKLKQETLIHYEKNPEEAIRMLEADGWQADAKTGIRKKQAADGTETALELRVAVPENEALRRALEEHWLKGLEQAGIRATLVPMGMAELYNAYRGMDQESAEAFDLILIGDDFTADLELKNSFRVKGTEQGVIAETPPGREETLEELNRRLYDRAADVNHTEPGDVLGYMRKWVALQKEVNGALPVIPLYSNVYFDFYTPRLHEYHADRQITWADAILAAYLSDMEDLTEEEEDEIRRRIQYMKESFDPMEIGRATEGSWERTETEANGPVPEKTDGAEEDADPGSAPRPPNDDAPPAPGVEKEGN